MTLISRYSRWLHLRWPAGTVEPLPEVGPDYRSNVPGLYIVGDLTGVPLLKFSAHSGALAIQDIVADADFQRQREKQDQTLDVVIIGAGVSGMSAALAAREAGLRFELLEATEPFSTIVNFPKGKPIFTYPTGMVPAGQLRFEADVKEPLVAELLGQTIEAGITPSMVRAERVERRGTHFEVVIPDGDNRQALRVVVGIGRSGNFRKLGVPGEDLDKVSNRLHDPQEFADRDVLVVGGGDSAMEAAIAVACAGGRVTLSYRKPAFSRPKPDNVERLEALRVDPMADVAVDHPTSERVTTSAGAFLEGGRQAGAVQMMMASKVQRIEPRQVVITDADGGDVELPNDAVFTMIGREAPLEFFRRSGVRIQGEMTSRNRVGMGLFVALCAFLYHWKSGGALTTLFKEHHWFPFNIPELLNGLSAAAGDPSTLIGILSYNLGKPGFYYSTAYCVLVAVFGWRRVRRRQTPYVKWQTASLAAFQILPLFLLPYIILPLMGLNGWFDTGFGRSFADTFLPQVDYDLGREYWRAFGFVLAWPLFVWNVFTHEPLWGWLAVSLVQTFVILPLIIYRWGKGAYCGWICSCGALAETLGDGHRHKMIHGPSANRWNLLGQVILGICLILLLTRVTAWIWPHAAVGVALRGVHEGLLYGWQPFGVPLNYAYLVDLLLAGVVGYGVYFWYSGRVWCRFACPLAALMHIYARFSRFRILADKKKCISCNVCTSVCHQGIDIMNFANKGLPMADPECVRCSACVGACPTGVLEFGQVDSSTGQVITTDPLRATNVHAKAP
ncbi:MAG: NAD(P)-binding domain-containing protein [Gemmatimonadetes bacterium]|jgi:NosR/NirI family transcriptional regulator, nitrous oxide reductase regulator|nr:NAD(P)-binding domain-containing protein [Gemmatimonadota bacterium]MBT7858900.1 NAD(P)-binding domain-containing protein [Gemmatimonadota bacterium]